MAKRVRGYKLDIELAEAGKAKRPALGRQQEQQTRSALGTGLLALWSHCHTAVLQGCPCL